MALESPSFEARATHLGFTSEEGRVCRLIIIRILNELRRLVRLSLLLPLLLPLLGWSVYLLLDLLAIRVEPRCSLLALADGRLALLAKEIGGRLAVGVDGVEEEVGDDLVVAVESGRHERGRDRPDELVAVGDCVKRGRVSKGTEHQKSKDDSPSVFSHCSSVMSSLQ